MGGTSTDVAHYDGGSARNSSEPMELERTFDTEVAGVRVRAPMISIHTVAAGGGSVCAFDGYGRLRVGPASAGAVPGPMSYRMGGPIAITDCNVVLGKLQPDYFPAVMGKNHDQTLDVSKPRAALEALAEKVQAKKVRLTYYIF